jgi:hypothetical protein
MDRDVHDIAHLVVLSAPKRCMVLLLAKNHFTDNPQLVQTPHLISPPFCASPQRFPSSLRLRKTQGHNQSGVQLPRFLRVSASWFK